ncbi:MAG: hypothetical protein M1391_00835 [Bacteroidetes bacterium]|nr:hypothetical protein [Bacteroidota bacterium]
MKKRINSKTLSENFNPPSPDEAGLRRTRRWVNSPPLCGEYDKICFFDTSLLATRKFIGIVWVIYFF